MRRSVAAGAVITYCFVSMLAVGTFFLPATSHAQDPQSEQTPAPPDETGQATDPLPAMFPRPETDRLWLSGQANIISQWHPPFRSPYQGRNSLSPQAQDASSRVLTLYTGPRLTGTTELLCDVQETGGHGIGEAFGLAGFTNLDVVRNPSLSKAPYIARLMWHQIIPLGHAEENSARTALSLFSTLPERRLELRFGKFGIADFFDLNNYGSDSSFQFLNWTVDNNGAYDYAADTRGYTFAAMLEYHERHGSIRFAEALMPKVANGIHLDADVSRARAENIEVELRGSLFPHREGILRLLSYVNHANMGSYREAINNYFAGLTPIPEITAHPLRTTIKYGFGANFEQPFNEWFGIFGRWGWNEGRHESYAYTEVDNTVELGVGASGGAGAENSTVPESLWFRTVFREIIRNIWRWAATAFCWVMAVSITGEKRLRKPITRCIFGAGFTHRLGCQHINNPGYNRDRGPVIVPSLRLHLEF
jgi:high affinity Mn2+ porin